MSHWTASKTASTATEIPSTSLSSSNPKCKKKVEKDFWFDTTENDDDDPHGASLSTHLLFPKESPLTSKEPLFPTSRKHFLMMTCKRTFFGCRGLFLFCFIVFIVISFVSSQSGNNRNNDSGRTLDLQQNGDVSEKAVTISDQHSNYETILLPPPNKEIGNKSELIVRFNINCTYRNTDYAVIGNALRKGLEFYEANVENITVLDAALGAKIVAEQLKQTQNSHQSLPLNLKTFLLELEAKANILTEQITNTVKRASNKTEDLKLTLPWIKTKDLWNLPMKKWYPVGSLWSYNAPDEESLEELWNIAAKKEVIDEKESDACISQVFHCNSANITEKCRTVFLNVERSMYSLTHQVIYMLLAQKNKCYAEPAWKQVPTLSDSGYPFLEKLCGKVWQEANSIVEANFPPGFRDLFIEQIGMCSLAGYSDFLRRDWLRRIISWQSISTSGCFGDRRRREPPTIGMLLREYQRLSQQQADNLSSHHRKRNGNIRRYKRSDVILENGNDHEKCSVHFTSVGITALSLHLRHFFDTCLESY